MKKILVSLSILIINILSLGQQSVRPEAKLVHRYFTKGDFVSVAQEAALDLKAHAEGSGDMVAIRICSNAPMPLALSTSAISPFTMLEYLDHYGFSREQIIFLRSEDCLNADPRITATEFWAIPKGATFPPFIERISSCQAKLELIGTKSPITTERTFKATLSGLALKLHSKPRAVGTIIGYYYKSPSLVMKRKMREVQAFLKQKGIAPGQYYISLQQWPGNSYKDSPYSEPKYPEMEIIEILKDCN